MGHTATVSSPGSSAIAADRGSTGLLPRAAGELGARLRARFADSGPIATSFGIYLGSRVDLLSGTDCLRLLEIPDRAEVSPIELVAELVDRELGAPLERLFASFETEPFDSGLVFQWHDARLADGERVVLQVAHPELERRLQSDELRRLIERLIADRELPPATRGAVREFECLLDLRSAAESLERLAEGADGSRWAKAPDLYPLLCSQRVLGTGRIPAVDAGRGSPEARCRRLARTWLMMVLRGEWFPVAPWGRDVRILERGHVLFLGTEVHRLQHRLSSDLKEYLAAVAAGEASRAALAYTSLLPGATEDRRLRHRLRHADPFRDPGLDVDGDLFVRRVLAHWRTAEECGYRPPEELLPFYRGLFLLNQEMRRPGSGATPIQDGLREARLLLLADELHDEVKGDRWSDTLESQLSLLSDLPRRLDRILDLASDRHDREVVTDRPRTGPGRGAAVSAGALALTLVVLLTHYVAGTGAFGAWPERVGALLVLMLGALVLRIAAQPEDD